MAKNGVNVTVNLSAKNKLIQSFSKGSQLQKTIDSEVVRLSDPYAPSDTSALRKSAFTETDFGSGRIKYLIYGNVDGRNTWNDTTSKFQDAPKRGAFWVIRMLVDGGAEKLKREIQRFMGK
jgi:hypothetical protein